MITDVEEEIAEEKKTETNEEREEEAHVNNEEPEDAEDTEDSEEEEKSEEDELEDDFNDFKKTTSDHKFTQQVKDAEKSVTDKMSANDEFLISMFSGMFFSLCDGLHGFIFNFFSKHKLNSEDIELTEGQRKGLEIYFKTERVIKFLNKLSPELIGIVHMEWLYFQNMKLYNKKQDALIEAQREKKNKTEKPPVKKKKRKKKKPVETNEG